MNPNEKRARKVLTENDDFPPDLSSQGSSDPPPPGHEGSTTTILLAGCIGAIIVLLFLGMIGFAEKYGTFTAAAATIFGAIVAALIGALFKMD